VLNFFFEGTGFVEKGCAMMDLLHSLRKFAAFRAGPSGFQKLTGLWQRNPIWA
jgi:hypothetical protein